MVVRSRPEMISEREGDEVQMEEELGSEEFVLEADPLTMIIRGHHGAGKETEHWRATEGHCYHIAVGEQCSSTGF
ncbi:hypothetical protein ACFX2J_012980 [Malus domestica]